MSKLNFTITNIVVTVAITLPIAFLSGLSPLSAGFLAFAVSFPVSFLINKLSTDKCERAKGSKGVNL